jgi:hypothetical protein
MIEEINLRRRTVHVEINEPLRLGGKMRQAGQCRMHITRGLGHGALAEELRDGDAAQLQAGALEKLPSVLELMIFVRGIHRSVFV